MPIEFYLAQALSCGSMHIAKIIEMEENRTLSYTFMLYNFLAVCHEDKLTKHNFGVRTNASVDLLKKWGGWSIEA